MFRAQLAIVTDRDAALASVSEAEKTYEDVLSQPMNALAPEAHQRVLAAFTLMQQAAADGRFSFIGCGSCPGVDGHPGGKPACS